MRGFVVDREVPVPVFYEGVKIDAGFRLDLLVNKLVVVETKAVLELHPVFEAQVHTHLKLTNKRLGFLINFNVRLIRDGLKRVIN